MAETKEKIIPVSFKSLEGDTLGTFVGTLSTYGNVDFVGDVCEKGCFSNVEVGKKFPLLWQHDPTQPIGSFNVIDTEEALTIEGKLNLGTTLGKDAYALLKEGDLDGLSIGYRVVDCKWDDEGIRHLTNVILHEGSLVTFPANGEATIGSVKACHKKGVEDLAFLSKLSDEDREEAIKELNAFLSTDERESEAESSEDDDAKSTDDDSEDQSGGNSEEDKADESEDEEEEKSESDSEEEPEEDAEEDEEKSWSASIEILNKIIQRL